MTQPMLRDNLFKDRVLLVTGGGSGLGKVIAELFLRLGGRAFLVSRNTERLEKAVGELSGLGRVDMFECDVRDPHRVRKVFREVLEQCDGIDCLVNNAAGNFIRPALKLPEKAFSNVIDIVVKGSFHCSKAFAAQAQERGRPGSILNILATYAWHGGPGTIHSAVGKAGVLAMTRTLAVEWSHLGIRVNAVAPGPMDTAGASSRLWPSGDLEEKLRKELLPGRFVSLEEVADACLYLMSDHASYINGECLTMDGGDWLGRGILKVTGSNIPVVRRDRTRSE